MIKTKDEFKVGNHNIGWVDNDFTREYGEEEILPGSVLKFQTLPRTMTDSEIISELKVEECTLGDILETIKNATPDMKDGNYNIFYIKGHSSRVVSVYWYEGEWRVFGWRREHDWYAGFRVFSPATPLGARVLKPLNSDTQTLEFCECERCGQCGKIIKEK